MHSKTPLPRLATFAAALLLASPPIFGEQGDASSPAAAKPVNWITGDGVSLGGVLFPHIHFNSVYGGSTGDPKGLAEGADDPSRNGWTIQGAEFGASARFTQDLEAFGVMHLKYDLDTHKSEHEFEEWFGKIKNIPGGFELRGGRYLNRFGFQNSVHNHGWDFVDQNLVNARFLGDDSLATIGGEVTWTLPVSWTSLLSVSVGVPPTTQVNGASTATFNSDGARFKNTFFTANWTNNLDYNDFHQFRFGASGAWGENQFDRTTQIYGAHLEYQWRQNGYEAGGSYFRWRHEALLRSFGAVSDLVPGERANLREFGVVSALAYGLDCGLEFGLRGDFVSGIASAGLAERFRLSPAVTYYFNKSRTLFLRGQYNYDHSNSFGDEHSVWAQIGYNWGGPEVR